MSKFTVLFWQSYLGKLKAKSFLITTFLFMLTTLAIFMWPTISGWFASSDRSVQLAVVDRTGNNAVSLFQDSNRLKFKPYAGNSRSADHLLDGGRTDGVLVLRSDGGKLKAELQTSEALKLNDQQAIDETLQTVGRLYAVQQAQLTANEARQILDAHVPLTQKTIGNQANFKSSASKTNATWISYAVAFFIYLFVASYLSMIASEVAAEKDSRIMEVIISSSSPVVHLLSRVAAILALAFTQLAVIVGAALIMAAGIEHGKYWRMITSVFSMVSVSYLIYAFLFFLAACLLYTLLGAVLGSLVNKVQEVGQAIGPITIVLMLGFFVAISGINNPDTLLIKICSFIPFIASMIMPMRIGATDMGYWQANLSLVILFATIAALFLFSLRFYRGSVLTYGSGSLIKKIKQALSLSK